MLLARTGLTMFHYLIQGYGVMIPSSFRVVRAINLQKESITT
jgi:hypothetical protein